LENKGLAQPHVASSGNVAPPHTSDEMAGATSVRRPNFPLHLV